MTDYFALACGLARTQNDVADYLTEQAQERLHEENLRTIEKVPEEEAERCEEVENET